VTSDAAWEAVLRLNLTPYPENPREWLMAKGLLTLARQEGREGEFYREWLARRRERLAWDFTTQRKWQSRVSRRPWRGRHHDSWEIRAKFVAPHRTGEWGLRDRLNAVSKEAREKGAWL
jgi:hypothetical protein